MDLKVHSFKIKELREQKEYDKALEYYKMQVADKADKNEIRKNLWLVADVIHCLRKKEMLGEATKYYLSYLKLGEDALQNVRLKSELGWVIFSSIKEGDAVPQTLARVYLKIVHPVDDTLLFTALFWKLIQLEYKRQQPDVLFLKETLGKMDPSSLSDKINKFETIIKGKKRTIELASDRQKWFIEYCKTLFLNAEYEKCEQCIDRAFSEKGQFKPDQKFWLQRRKFQAVSKQGRYAEAIEGLGALLDFKTDWFLFKDLAEVNEMAGEKENALNHAIIAALLPGKTEFKLTLFEFMANKLTGKDMQGLHYALCYAIREKMDWKQPAHLEEYQALSKKVGSKKTEIVEFWLEQLKKNGRLKKGAITKILNPGRIGDGFIADNEGVSVYFRMNEYMGDSRLIKEGGQVYFIARDSFYKNKQVQRTILLFSYENRTNLGIFERQLNV